MNAMISSKQRVSHSPRGTHAQQPSRQLRYKHLAFGVGLALGSLLVCGMASAAGAVAANQSPTGGKVVGGTGSITQSGASTVINQQSQMLALDWQTFNVGKDASVLFNQPGTSAIALNRILDQNPSQIFGKVTSNGQIFLINTHGIIFGASAQLNVGGLVASTLDLTPNDFLKEHFSLDAHGANAGIVNHGTIAAASGGSVSLIGGQVQNDGLIVADYGHINLDGADKAVLDFDGNGLISVEITGALQQRLNADQAAVENKGTLKATSGTVVLQASAAKGLFTDMVNNSGVIKAGGISTAGGVVRLVGSGGNVTSSGTIDASGSTGGSVQVLSDQDVAMSGSIHADATQNGDGGDILVKGDGSADISGTLTARGGAQGGNGGLIETSGTRVHVGDSARINTLAAFGQAGTWLIDPEDFVIGSTANSDISGATLGTNLGSGNVTILSSDGTHNASGNGDIIILDPLSWSANHTLILKAARNIEIDNAVTASGNASLTLEPSSTGTADPQDPTGTLLIDSAGSLSMSGNGTFTLPATITNNGALIFGLGGNYSYGGVISGTGTLEQKGSKTLTLTGVNTYAGTTTIDSGAKLALSGMGSIAASSGVQADGTFDVSGTTSGASIQSLAGAGAVAMGSQMLTITNASGATGGTFAGVISGNGALALTGGTEILTGTSNTYKGGTTISNGTLQVADDGSLGDSAGDVTINSGGTLRAGADFNSARTIHIANIAHLDTNGHTVGLSGDVTSGDGSQGSFDKEGAGTLTLTGTGNLYKYTNVNGGTLALKNGGVLGGQFLAVASGATFDISQLTAAGVTALTLAGAGEVDLGSKTLTIGAGNTPWTFSGVLADGGIGGGTGGSLVMDDPNVIGVLSGTNTYTGDTTIKSGTLSVSGDANLGSGGGLVLNGGTLENTASFTLNHAVSIGNNGGTLQNDTGTNLTVANAITGTGDLTQNGPGTLTVNANVTTTGATQTYNGTLALGNAVTLTGSTVNLGTVNGNSHDLTVAGNAVLNGVVTAPNLVVTGAGNELNFGTAGSVSGNVDAATLDYGNYATAVTFDAANGAGATTGIGGTWSNVANVIGNATNAGIIGLGAGTFTLSGTNAGSAGGITYSGFTAADAAQVAGAAGFDDGAKSSEGITFANATNVDGSGTIGNVGGNFDDGTGQSSASSITYTGFGTVAGTSTGSVTNVTGSFDDGTRKSLASGRTYTGFGAVSGTGGSVTGVTGDFDAGTDISSASGIDYSGFNLANVAASGTSAGITGLGATLFTLTGNQQGTAGAITFTSFASADTSQVAGATGFDDQALSSRGMTFANATNVAGTGTISNVGGSFDDGAEKSSASGITYTGFDTVTGSGGSVTGVTGDFNVDSDVSASGIDYSGFNLTTVAGSGAAATLTGAGDTFTLTGSNAGGVGGLTFTGFGNILDAAGTLDFGTAGSVSGNVTADTLDYGSYGSAVAVNLSGTGTTGVGGTVSGVSSITSLNSLAVTGASAGDLGLTTTGAGATTTLGGLIVNGNLGVDSAGAVLQGGAGPLVVAGTTGINAHANAITLNDAGNSLTGVVTLGNSGANAVTVNNGTHALQLGNVHVGTGSLTLTGTGITQASGTTLTQAAGAGAATFNAGAGVLTLANTGNDLTGMVGLTNSGAYDVTLDNGANPLSLGNVNVGSGALKVDATGITQVAGTGIVQAPGAGMASFNAHAGVLNLNSTLNGFTGTVNLANSGNYAVYLDNGGNALTLGTLSVGSGPLTITDYGVGALLLTQDVTTNGGAVNFGGAVTIDGSPTVTVDTTGGGSPGANISFGGDVNAAAPNADSLTLNAGNGAVNFGGAVGNTAALQNLTTTSKTFSVASTLGVGQDLSITTTAGPISQSAAWTVGGASMLDAGSNAITLTDAGNSFGGPITVTGGAVEIGGTGTLDMGAVSASSLKLDGASVLHDDITTSGAQTYNGAVTLAGSGNSVALSGNGITFAGTVDNLASATPQDLTVNSGTGAAKFGGAVGGVNGPLGALSVTGTGQAQFLGNVAAASLDATAPVLLDADITTSGNQKYNGAVALGGNVNVSSNNGNVTFASTLDNAVSGTPESLTVTAANGAVTFGNAVGSLNGALGNLSSSSKTFSDSGAFGIGGNLTVTTTAGDITQGAAWKVTGNSVFNAGNNAVALGNPNNDFTGSVTLTGAGVAVTDVNDLTIGGLTDNNNGDVSLIAGGQLYGVGPINAGTGSITLTAAGAVLTTAALTGGDISLTGGNGISLGDDVNAGGTLTLNSGGNIDESATTVITASALTGMSAGSTHLDGNNLIASLGNFTANGFSLTNGQALTVASGITIDGKAGGTALKTTAGDLTINGTVGNAAGTTSLTSAGNINEGAGGVVIANQLTGSSVGDTTLTGSNNKIASVGLFNAVNFTLIDNAALSVLGPLHTTGDISLTTTGGPANVLNVGQALTGGSVTLVSAGDLSITQAVQGSAVDLTANGNLSIDSAVNSGAGATTLTQNGAGSISEGVGGSITAGSLTGTAQGAATLNGANAVASLGDFTAVGFSLTNATDLTVAAGSTLNGGASTSLTTTGAGSDLTIDGNVNGTTTTLVSAGAINEGASGVVTADTLTGSAASAAQLTGNNAINKLGNFTAASLALTNGKSLTIGAGNAVDGGSSTTLTTTGANSDLVIDGSLKGSTTTLNVGGAISEGTTGALTAGTLTGSSGGATDLTGNNAVASLGNFTASGFALTSNQALAVNSGATVDGGTSTSLTTTGAGHDIGINGTVKGDLITLVSAGAIGEGSGGLVQGGDLTGSSVGDTTLGNTQVDNLDAFDAANFSLTNAGALTVNGPLSTTGNAGDISLTTTGAGHALTLNQVVQGASITLASAGDLTVADAVTGTQVALAADGSLAIDAAVSSGAGTTTLTQTGTGAITGGSNGSITAATLTGSATGTTTLGSAGQFMANHVGTLGGFSSPAGFSFTNDGTLTLASVGGSAFTIDAGKSALYLEVRNGDLLQNGNNWLYDGTGSFSAPDGHIGLQTAPIYVTGVSAQSVPAIGMPPAYFYAIDYSGNLLPLTGSNAVNVPTAILSSNSQGVNGHSDQYIDISVVTAVYQAYGVVPTGLLLPKDQSACSPDQPPSELCPEDN
ncbi:MAG TPA: filamentous hemagglutinin N-terminal domain-containing protein [Rhodanobacteraceae bacterium]|nr:filamentous hemagglutinin N-terminal domain-containing protein [Rhodanobacteraceae bacterium]